MSNLISLKKISKNYILNNKVKALRNINFDFEIGKVYSIVGPSGSGKSTLLNILSLIDKPTSGNMKIDGKSIDFNNDDLNDKFNCSVIGFNKDKDNIPGINIFVKDKELYQNNDFEFTTYHTPGHTKGHVIFHFHIQNLLFQHQQNQPKLLIMPWFRCLR